MKKISSFVLAFLFIFVFTVRINASTEPTYVFDHAGLLTASQQANLEEKASRISSEFEIGVYIVTVEDFQAYHSDIFESAIDIYEEKSLGMGSGRDGILLLLSMAERDYYLLAHGESGNTAFNDDAKRYLAEFFLDDFSEDDWQDGFSDYLSTSQNLMQMASEGSPYSAEYFPELTALGIFASLILGVIGAFLICRAFKKKMKSVAEQSKATVYIAKNGIRFTKREDRYIRTTVSRTKIQRNNNSGGGGGSRSSGGSGGYSGRGGKF